MPSVNRVAVIGAGISGILAIKSLKEESIEPVCFEKTGQVGGLWKYREDDVEGVGSVMKSTIINTSKELSALSDFPPPAEAPNFMHHTLMYEYILSYAKKNDCLRYVRNHHETVKIEKADDYEETGRWKVTNMNKVTGELTSEVFDGVMICTGHHVYPNEPTFPGQEKFKGKILHSHSLKKVDSFEDQKVVVLGTGNSGMDAAAELSSVTRKVYLSTRKGAWIFPRLGAHGYPIDIMSIRRLFYKLQSLIPYNLLCTIAEREVNKNFDHSLYNLQPKHRIFSQHPTISDTLPIKLLSGLVVIRGVIKEFTENGVIFDGEEEETEVDAVIMATGYKVKFPFLSDDILHVEDNNAHLYKYIIPPHLPHPTFAIIGLVQPAGAGFPVAEIQCRWAVMVLCEKVKLPSVQEMMSDIHRKESILRKYYVDSPRHRMQVNVITYPDELAEDIGVKPNLLKLAFTDFKLFLAVLTGPHLPYQYRLHGPHSWDGAREAILTCMDRVKKPLIKPSQELRQQDKPLLKTGLITKLIFLLPFLYLCLYLTCCLYAMVYIAY